MPAANATPLFEIKLEISASSAENANDVLLELGNERWSILEDVIVSRAWIVGIFSSADEAQQRTDELLPLLSMPPVSAPQLRELAASEWRDSYKAHFHAWQFGRLHWVPVWERTAFQLPPGDAVLWLDPGLAFGTGNHETTRLCVERLVSLALSVGTRGSVIDAGCGSGILALSAVKLGWHRVAGFDNDPEAIRVSVENASLNDLQSGVEFSVGDLTSGFCSAPADVVLANILANVLIEFAAQLTAAVAPGGALVLSGILAVECDQVRAAFSLVAPSWPQQSKVMGEWSDVLLTRPS